MIGLLFGGLIKSALGFLKGLPWQVWAGIGALIAVLFVWHVHTGWEKASAKAAFNSGYNAMYARYDAEVKKNAIQRASIDRMQAAIEDQNRAVQALASESDTRTKAADQARIAAQEAARASNDTARALDASAAVARADAGKCAPSDEFWNSARKEL